ncbi:hypothetical protein [Reinekea sp.]|jgi:glutathione S-transferase|uniref:hypothetical protein n=1 Tax=Reinekea sp. TaxID=1970455 RepID=UPI002A8286E1|nr:hypothetical protein [Reinekea sp.]
MTSSINVAMLADGSNPEGVDPQPALNWTSQEALTNVVVHGPAFSHATTKLRTFLLYGKIPFTHEQHLKDKPQGIKPNTDYRKIPVIDVAGRQVNDSWIILKHLLPALDLIYHDEWERRIVLELDTSFKLHCTGQDWARLAVATVGAPWLMKWLIGPVLKRLEQKQARHNIAHVGLGHKEVDEIAFARDFKQSLRGPFHQGDRPGHVDLSFYGFLAGYLYADCPIATDLIRQTGLQQWLDSMTSLIPLASLFPKEN